PPIRGTDASAPRAFGGELPPADKGIFQGSGARTPRKARSRGRSRRAGGRKTGTARAAQGRWRPFEGDDCGRHHSRKGRVTAPSEVSRQEGSGPHPSQNMV